MKKIMKHLIQDNWYLILCPPKYEAGVPSPWVWHLVTLQVQYSYNFMKINNVFHEASHSYGKKYCMTNCNFFFIQLCALSDTRGTWKWQEISVTFGTHCFNFEGLGFDSQPGGQVPWPWFILAVLRRKYWSRPQLLPQVIQSTIHSHH
jgi:hypothetical protein